MAAPASMLPLAQLSSEPLRHALTEGLRRARARHRPVLVSVTARVDQLDPLAVFAAGMGLGAWPLYWEGRTPEGGRLALAGAGAAHTLMAEGPERFAAVASAWRELRDGAVIETAEHAPGAGPLLMGGASFDPLRPRTPAWRAFPAALFVLPRFTLGMDDAASWITANVVVHPGDAGEAVAEAALRGRAELLACSMHWMGDELLHPAAPSSRPASCEDLTPALEWQDAVVRTAREIREGRFAKVVLARQARLRPGPSTPVGLGPRAVQALARLRQGYPGSSLFAVARPGLDEGGAAIFLGASPERLIRLHAGHVEATCLAGSIRRGATPEEDARLGQALLDSAKDRAEHAVVARMLREALGPVCRDLQMPDAPTLLKLANVQHLYTPIRGRLAGAECVLELVGRLHPTPAVGGYPRREALAAIRERESLDRGWYAAPVGWLDEQGEGEFAVAIRSALLRTIPAQQGYPARDEALLFAGCGIMGDSDPATEYQESRLKMQPMLGALRD